uniref:Uncharacterized protein n=1 Tax=Arundo donax TaxID=35708 RepID=A0A0A9F5S2_ARUDO
MSSKDGGTRMEKPLP